MLPTGLVFANRYIVQGPIGRGGQGEVYAAFDKNEQFQVALKLLAPTVPDRQWVEAAILRNLSDHHILPIHNADDHLGQAYLVTALARNGSIDNHVKHAGTAGLPVDEVVAWIRQACQGIGRGHGARLVHNDVKPANLFLNDKSECVVADWGFAAQTDPSTGLAYAMGATLETIAPEVAAAWSPTGPVQSATVASDVFSLGASAYWMLAGVPPLDLSASPTQMEKMAAAAAGGAPRLRDTAPHVPRWVSDRIEKATAAAPSDRYAKAQDFAAALGQRPTVTRRWTRTNEHGAHEACWRGEPVKHGSTLVMCMVAAAGRKVDITTSHPGSGKRVTAGCGTATRATWPKAVRGFIAAVS